MGDVKREVPLGENRRTRMVSVLSAPFSVLARCHTDQAGVSPATTHKDWPIGSLVELEAISAYWLPLCGTQK